MNTGLYTLLGFFGGCLTIIVLIAIVAIVFSLKDDDKDEK